MRVALLVMVASCGRSEVPPARPVPPASPPIVAVACLAETLGPLRDERDFGHACTQAFTCDTACNGGDARACMAHAYGLQRLKQFDAADPWFRRGCEGGIALGCTNLAAASWAHPRSDADYACARRVFDRACQAREVMACGMLGRMLAADATTPEATAEARAYFERVCAEQGGATCRMYGLHVEQGDFGSPDLELARKLLVRACATGDREACGHDLPSETFHDTDP